ncbi:MAG: cell envelope integrity protein TolA [Bacteroidales bacterium]|nr:cell envelope integrity protein TolA [Bacteroidales bacterium]
MESRAWGVIGSLLFHIGLIILLFVSGFSTPLPLPAEEGVMINFGDGPDGSGLNEPSISQAASRPQPRPAQPDPTPLTQDYEEAPALPVPPRTSTKPTTKPTPKPTTQPTTAPEQPTNAQPEPTPEPPKPTLNPKASFPGQKVDGSASSGEGESGRPGNQGSPDGSPDSGSRTGGGNGAGGTGGNGFSLEGRNLRGALPKPVLSVQKAGDVVIRIRVDAQGNVISADVDKTTGSVDSDLVDAARKAAMKAKFTASEAALQSGTITYRFRLN